MTSVESAPGDLAVIPAKARSTRLPGKNQALLGGKTLVVRAVEVARESGLFDTVMVSTDDPAIAELANAAGAEVPFRRDAALTEDTVEVPEVARDALEWYQRNGQRCFECEVNAIAFEPQIWACGGLDKKIEIYRLAAQPAPREFSATVSLTKLRPGDNPIYTRVIQQDGHMAWTSPVYWV